MIVGFIPRGKIMKPISKIVNGFVDFGNRGKLANIINTTIGEEAHHMIPWNKLGDDVVQEAAYAGFHMNAEINGKALQKYSALIGEGLHGNHPAYDKFVQKRMNDFMDDTINPENTRKFLEEVLIPELNSLIDDAIDSGMNLNTYFRDVINPLNGIN